MHRDEQFYGKRQVTPTVALVVVARDAAETLPRITPNAKSSASLGEQTAPTSAKRERVVTPAALGVRNSIYDVGTGHSSLNDLRNFGLDCVKTDRSFLM